MKVIAKFQYYIDTEYPYYFDYNNEEFTAYLDNYYYGNLEDYEKNGKFEKDISAFLVKDKELIKSLEETLFELIVDGIDTELRDWSIETLIQDMEYTTSNLDEN